MTVHVLATGGTISSHWDGSEWTNLPGGRLVDELGELPVEVEVHDLATGPSSNLTSDDMLRVAREVEARLAAGATGVVVVHGTDTMELTAFATQLVVGTHPNRRPVVFTGSMRVHSHPDADGPRNLRDAITVAASDAAVGRDVLVCLAGRLHAADRVRKVSAASVDAFDSLPFTPAGRVEGGELQFVAPPAIRTAAPRWGGPVAMVTCSPGADVTALPEVPGVVVAGYGDLNLPYATWGAVHAATRQGTAVVVASQVFTPNLGGDDMRSLGAVGAGGLTPQKARLALLAALGSTSRVDEAYAFVHQYALPFDAGDRSTS